MGKRRRLSYFGGMRLFPSSAACCPADRTLETAVHESTRGKLATNIIIGRRVPIYSKRRAKRILHIRGSVIMWHWSDVNVDEPANAR